MTAFFIGFFSSMVFAAVVMIVAFLKDAFKSGFVLGD